VGIIGAQALEHGEAGAAQLGGPVQVQDAQLGAELHVVQGLLHGGGGAPALDLGVGLLVLAHRHRFVGQVGDGGEERLEGRFRFLFRGFQAFEPVAHVPLGGDERIGVLFGPLQLGHFIRHAVALGLEALGLLDHPPAFALQALEGLPVERHAPLGQAEDDGVEIIAQKRGVKHGCLYKGPL
jgi:hypothetical protein